MVGCCSATEPAPDGKLIEALVLVCGLALAILLQGELRRLLELLGTGRLAVLMGSRPTDLHESGTVDLLVDTAVVKRRCGGLIVLDLGSDLRRRTFSTPESTSMPPSRWICC